VKNAQSEFDKQAETTKQLLEGNYSELSSLCYKHNMEMEIIIIFSNFLPVKFMKVKLIGYSKNVYQQKNNLYNN